MTMLGLGGISIMNSVAFKRPRDAIAMTYLMVLAYIALSSVLYAGRRSGWAPLSTPIWFGDDPPTLDLLAGFVTSGNLFVGMSEFAQSLYTGGNAVDAAWRIVRAYAVFHGIVAIACTVWAT